MGDWVYPTHRCRTITTKPTCSYNGMPTWRRTTLWEKETPWTVSHIHFQKHRLTLNLDTPYTRRNSKHDTPCIIGNSWNTIYHAPSKILETRYIIHHRDKSWETPSKEYSFTIHANIHYPFGTGTGGRIGQVRPSQPDLLWRAEYQPRLDTKSKSLVRSATRVADHRIKYQAAVHQDQEPCMCINGYSHIVSSGTRDFCFSIVSSWAKCFIFAQWILVR